VPGNLLFIVVFSDCFLNCLKLIWQNLQICLFSKVPDTLSFSISLKQLTGTGTLSFSININKEHIVMALHHRTTIFFASRNSLFLQKIFPYPGEEFFRDSDRHFII
jgi:hypothetical protein